jgi:acetate kinase
VLATHAKTLEARRESYSLLTINGGSSSIRFALFDVGEPLRRLLDGKVDRIGLSGTSLPFKDATGQSQNTIDASDRHSAVSFLLDWLEAQQVFASVNAVGHRVVHGMTHSEPEGITSELLDELHRITPCDPDHLALEFELIRHFANVILNCVRWRVLIQRFTARCRESPVCCRFRDATRHRAFDVMAFTGCPMNFSWRNSLVLATPRQQRGA